MYDAAQATATKLIAEKECIEVELENGAGEHNITLAKIQIIQRCRAKRLHYVSRDYEEIKQWAGAISVGKANY